MKKIIVTLILTLMMVMVLSTSFAGTRDEEIEAAREKFRMETQKLSDQGYTAGQLLLDYGFIPESQMDLNENITREEFIAVLIKLIGEDNKVAANKTPTFSDVPNGHPYFQVVERAYELGYVSGVGNGQFGIGQTISNNDILYVMCKIDGFLQDVSYQAHFDRVVMYYNIDGYKEYQPVPKGQVYGWLLIMIEHYSHVTKDYVYKQMPLSKEELSTFGSIHEYLVDAPHKFMWEGATLYKNSKTFGTPEESDKYFELYKRIAEDIRNVDRACSDLSEKSAYIASYERKIENSEDYLTHILAKFGLELETMDRTNPDFEDVFHFTGQLESLKLEAQNQIAEHENFLKANNIVIDGHYLLAISEEKYEAYKSFLDEINYDYFLENYKTMGKNEITTYLNKIGSKYYLFLEAVGPSQQFEQYMKKNSNNYPAHYYERAIEINKYNSKKSMNMMYFRTHYDGYDIEYVFRLGGLPDAIEVTREEYDRK